DLTIVTDSLYQDQEPKREMAMNDDLLDDDQVDVVGREDGHHARRDAGPVGPGDGEERRGAGGAHGFSWWFAWHALNPAGTGVPAGFIRPRRPRVSSGAVHGPGSVSLRRRSALGLVLGRIGAARLGTSTDVGLGPHPLTHVRVVQLER